MSKFLFNNYIYTILTKNYNFSNVRILSIYFVKRIIQFISTFNSNKTEVINSHRPPSLLTHNFSIDINWIVKRTPFKLEFLNDRYDNIHSVLISHSLIIKNKQKKTVIINSFGIQSLYQRVFTCCYSMNKLPYTRQEKQKICIPILIDLNYSSFCKPTQLLCCA